MIDETVASVAEAVSVVGDGASVMIGGFGEAGSPVELIHALIDQGTEDLTVVNNNTGSGEVGLAALIGVGQVRRMICSYPRSSHSRRSPSSTGRAASSSRSCRRAPGPSASAPAGPGSRLLHAHQGRHAAGRMTAGLTAMRLHDAEAVARLNRIGRLARDGLDEAIRASGVPASVTGAGSMFWIHLEAEAPRDYRSAFPTQREKAALDALLQALEDERILVIGTAAGMLSTPMGEAEIDALAEAVLASLRRIAPLLDAWCRERGPCGAAAPAPRAPDVVEGRRRLAFAGDDPAVFSLLTVWEHRRFVAELYRVPDWRARAETVLASFDMTLRRDAVVGRLSPRGGAATIVSPRRGEALDFQGGGGTMGETSV